MGLRYVFITLGFVTFSVYCNMLEDDTFICKKVSKRRKDREICFGENDRLRALEERLFLLEQRLMEQSKTLNNPTVLKLQHLAIPRGKVFSFKSCPLHCA